MRMLNFGLSQTLAVRRAKVPEALPMRQLVSVSNDAFDAILEPRSTKSLTFSMFFSSSLIVGGISVPWLSTLVFLRLMLRPKPEHADENGLNSV